MMELYGFLVSLAGACAIAGGVFRVVDRLEGRK